MSDLLNYMKEAAKKPTKAFIDAKVVTVDANVFNSVIHELENQEKRISKLQAKLDEAEAILFDATPYVKTNGTHGDYDEGLQIDLESYESYLEKHYPPNQDGE